jgi:HSP20 family protein
MKLIHWDPLRDLSARTWAPAVDIFDQDDDLIFRAEVPGVQREALDVKVEDNTLILSGERVRDEEQGQAYRSERRYGSFVRSFLLPKTVDPSRISAAYENGILEVRIPRAEAAKPRQIEIKVA